MAAADLFDLSGRVALVTGASRGLGARFAQVLAEAGAAVVLVARRADRLAALAERIALAGGKALAIAADVRERAAIGHAFAAAEAAFGPVDILINNAGVTHADRAVEISEAEWHRVPAPISTPCCSPSQEGAPPDRGREGWRDREHRVDPRPGVARALPPTRWPRPA